MKIAGLQRVTLLDYPERIAASVFLAGCNLDCGFCHNRWMLDEAAVQAALSREELLAWLETRRGKLDGVCVSGGEPTLHAELGELLRAIKALGFDVKLDTNGLLPERLAVLLQAGVVDYVAMDVKAPLDERYGLVAGRPVDVTRLRKSMAILRASGLAYEFRTTVGPQLDMAALRAIADEIGREAPWFLQVFEAVEGIAPVLAGQAALPREALAALADELRSEGWQVAVRGG
jgi:pyruvate formate lyase activating enzyme